MAPLELPNIPLPTLSRLGATVPKDLDAKEVAKTWFDAFSASLSSGQVQNLAQLVLPDAFWRDILAFTWDFRTFSGLPKITQFLNDRLQSTQPQALKIRDDPYLGLQQPTPDLAWINFFFDFETQVGVGSGIVRLVPTATGEWKAHTIFTNLEDLKTFPEKIGALRNAATNHGKWEEERKKEAQFEGTNPTVLIIGGGHAGLGLAARLKALGLSTLVVDKNKRVGDNWRNRYASLTLHDPVWYDHMPYLPFPSTWPVYAPAKKFANWLEHYAEALEINVWTSTTVLRASQDQSNSKWNVLLKREDGSERTLNVNHVVFATGYGSGKVGLPSYPGMDKYTGQILQMGTFKKGADHLGKKVVVVGACTSAHDIAVDCYQSGVDVTMYQRSSTCVASAKGLVQIGMNGFYSENGPPTAIGDRLISSFYGFSNLGLIKLTAQAIAQFDKEILDDLRKVGFRVNDGINGTGLFPLFWVRAGGYYIETGGSRFIADGKIKLKNDSLLQGFTETGLKFEDGSELQADVVVFATGIGDARWHIEQICEEPVVARCPPIWGMDAEGEQSGVWRDLGSKGLWYMMGNLMLCRFHSKHVAMQIKAMEEGVFGERYSLVQG